MHEGYTRNLGRACVTLPVKTTLLAQKKFFYIQFYGAAFPGTIFKQKFWQFSNT